MNIGKYQIKVMNDMYKIMENNNFYHLLAVNCFMLNVWR